MSAIEIRIDFFVCGKNSGKNRKPNFLYRSKVNKWKIICVVVKSFARRTNEHFESELQIYALTSVYAEWITLITDNVINIQF